MLKLYLDKNRGDTQISFFFSNYGLPHALTIVLSDGGVSTVGQGACLPRAQTREVVFIPTERLAVSPEKLIYKMLK